VSDGSISIPHEEKCKYISTLAKDLTVFSEVGSKESGILISPVRWVRMMQTELECGSWKVIAEARESGTVGIYRPSGHAHTTLVNRIIEKVPAKDIIWEAPSRTSRSGSSSTWGEREPGEHPRRGGHPPGDPAPRVCAATPSSNTCPRKWPRSSDR
jgi:phosphosulfolactate synthase